MGPPGPLSRYAGMQVLRLWIAVSQDSQAAARRWVHSIFECSMLDRNGGEGTKKGSKVADTKKGS